MQQQHQQNGYLLFNTSTCTVASYPNMNKVSKNAYQLCVVFSLNTFMLWIIIFLHTLQWSKTDMEFKFYLFNDLNKINVPLYQNISC